MHQVRKYIHLARQRENLSFETSSFAKLLQLATDWKIFVEMENAEKKNLLEYNEIALLGNFPNGSVF